MFVSCFHRPQAAGEVSAGEPEGSDEARGKKGRDRDRDDHQRRGRDRDRSRSDSRGRGGDRARYFAGAGPSPPSSLLSRLYPALSALSEMW